METATTSTETVEIACSVCGALRNVKPTVKGKPRPPRGWKNVGSTLTCSECWGKTYAIRAMTIPIASADWEVFRPILRQAQEAVTHLSNWAIRKLLANDVVRGPGEEKLPKMPPIYLYGMGPELASWQTIGKGTASAVLMSVEQRYRKLRYDMIWRNAIAPPSFRFPQPVPIRPDGFKLERKDERIFLIANVGGVRHELMLSAGRQFKRQTKAIEWLMEHPELLGQAALLEIEGKPGDHRPANKDRENGNGNRSSRRLMAKIVGWLPIKGESIPDNTLMVRSDKDSLLVCVDMDDQRIWNYNADNARMISNRHAAHLRELSRLSDDRKAEYRKPRRDGKPFQAHVQEKARRDRNRLQTLCHQVSASLVAYAARRKVAEIVYDDTDHSFAPSFPWAMLGTMIEQKARAKRIVVRAKTPPEKEEESSDEGETSQEQ